MKHRVDISDAGAQSDLEHTLRWSPFLRSLSVRGQRPLDLSQIQYMSRMKLLWVSGPIKSSLDLSRLRKLQLLGAGRGLNKVYGLESLGKLHYVHVEGPSRAWLSTLPISVKRLFLTKNKLENLDLSRFRNLEVLGFAVQKNISARKVKLPPNLNRLDLVRISTITHFEDWFGSCAKLEKINIDSCPDELVGSISPLANNAGVSLEVG